MMVFIHYIKYVYDGFHVAWAYVALTNILTTSENYLSTLFYFIFLLLIASAFSFF